MLAVGPLGPQYCWLFAWYELGRQAQPTCPGSKASLSLFQCPHDCFTETDVTEDTIEEMDEDDLDSLNTLVRQGFDIGTDNFSYRQVNLKITKCSQAQPYHCEKPIYWSLAKKDNFYFFIFLFFLFFVFFYFPVLKTKKTNLRCPQLLPLYNALCQILLITVKIKSRRTYSWIW